jgi:nucleoside-diphosphate-sugar epimerase
MEVKVGITGQQGLLGAAVTNTLDSRGVSVYSLDSFTRRNGEERYNIDGSPIELEWVLNFAAQTDIAKSWDDPFKTSIENLDATLIALKIASRSKAAFLYCSSYVYGIPKYLPIDEQHPLSATNPYMANKIAGEQLCRSLCGLTNIPLTILRPFNVYGEKRTPGRLVSDLLSAAKSGETMLLNDPIPKRDYLFAEDFADLILRIVSMPPEKFGTYNVGYGKTYSNLEVAQTIHRLSNQRSALVIKSESRPNDISDCSINSQLVQRAFSWRPKHSLEEGLSRLF